MPEDSLSRCRPKSKMPEEFVAPTGINSFLLFRSIKLARCCRKSNGPSNRWARPRLHSFDETDRPDLKARFVQIILENEPPIRPPS